MVLTLSILVVFKKTIFSRILLANSHQKKSLAMMKCKKMRFIYETLYKPCFLAVCHCQPFLLTKFGQKNYKKVFLNTTKIE